ncbi:MAG: hypothetical protein PHW83_10310, partial [Bacteroidales bacterium]|nr:hypothetical protein [Bacteroidales bacterium]
MKKLLVCLIIFISIANTILYAQVYQLPNGGFEIWDGTSSDAEPTNWNGFPSAECTLFLGCGTATATRHAKSTDIRPGTSGTYSCKLYATSALGIIANGNISTGQIRIGSTTATNFSENYNITRTADANFRQSISAKPDSIRFWAKFVCPSSTQNARMHAIIHDNYNYKDPEDGDANAGSHVVAHATDNFTRGNQDWTMHSVAFDYNFPSNDPAYILLTFTTNMIAGQGSTSDVLYIDDVEFVYNTLLSNIKINGVSINEFNPYTYNYYVDAECGESQTITAMAQSPNASVTIIQASGGSPANITVSSGDQSSTYLVYFNFSFTTHIYDEICVGEAYNNNGFIIPQQNTSGIHDFEMISYESEECDSIVKLHLSVNPSYIADTSEIMVCEGANYNFYGNILSEPGIYDTIIPTIYGCDSLVILKLSVGEYYRTYINAEICDGDIYDQNGFYMDFQGVDTIIYTAVNNCDSLVILNLIVNPLSQTEITDSITEGSDYNDFGFNLPVFTESGTYDYTLNLSNIYGCDS